MPTRSNILDALLYLTKNIGPEDRLLFFFAGHGTTDQQGEGNYLLPQDATLDNFPLQGLKLSEEILWAFERCQAREQIVIVDACHSGFRKGIRDEDTRDLEITAKRIESALDAFSQARSGRAVLTSSSRDQKSQEDDTIAHGVFTYYLVNGLQAFATDKTPEVDQDLDRRIDAGELFQYVQHRVETWCRENQRPPQTPRSRYDDAGANIPLATQPQEE